MKRYLLDTGIVSAYADHRVGVRERAKAATARGDRVGICMPVLGELYAGVELSQNREKTRVRLARALSDLFLWPFDEGAAKEYGRLFALLKRMGRPMQQIDMQVAAVALSLGNCTVVSKDSDLAAVPGLVVEDWSS